MFGVAVGTSWASWDLWALILGSTSELTRLENIAYPITPQQIQLYEKSVATRGDGFAPHIRIHAHVCMRLCYIVVHAYVLNESSDLPLRAHIG